LQNKGLVSPISIIKAYENDRLYDYVDDATTKFSLASAFLVEQLAQYLLWYRSAHGNFSNLDKAFTSQVFEQFVPETKSTTGTKEKEETSNLKLRMGDFPKFSGKNPDWPCFYERFSAVCEIQGLSSLLEEDIDHEDKYANDPDYRNKCSTLYSILKNSCAGGHALPKINKFKTIKNGHLAWREMCNSYYAMGDKEDYSAGCLADIMSLTLQPNSSGGAALYCSKWEDLDLKLEEAGHPLDPMQKKTFFLHGIKERKKKIEIYYLDCLEP
jgi:hypothetical protein